MEALEQQLQRRDDIRVTPGHWAWSEDSPFPKLDTVLKANIWQLEDYKPLRWRLSQPAVDPEVTLGGSFATVELAAKGTLPTQAEEGAASGAEPKPDVGALIHIFPIGADLAVPKEVAELSLAVVFFELDRMYEYVPGWLRRQVAKNVPVVLCGADWVVNDMFTSLQTQFRNERLLQYWVSLHTPTSGIGEDYRWAAECVLVVSRVPIKKQRQVCVASLRPYNATTKHIKPVVLHIVHALHP